MNNGKLKIIPVLATFFVMGFCDIVGISSDYMQASFDWSPTMTGFIPSMVFIWFLFLGIPIGNKMNKWGRKNTVIISMVVTVIGMFLPLVKFTSVSCIFAYIMLGLGNAILQISLNPLLENIISGQKMLASSLTAGQVIKAVSSLLGPEIILFSTSYFGKEYWYYSFPILGLITIFFAVWLILTPVKREKTISETISVKDSFSLLRSRVILLLFLGIFFIVGVDVATNYISSKLMASRFDWLPEEVKFAPQIYFLFRTIGALLGTILLTKVSSILYFRVNIVASLISLLLLMMIDNEVLNLICIGGIGFFASSVFSIIYSLAFNFAPDKINQISGLMITAVAGGGIVTPILGFAIENYSIAAGLFVILCCITYLIYCSFFVKII